MAKILLIDPDQQIGNITAEFLKQRGHLVKFCSSAQHGIHQADKYKPDLIILELQLPVHNGIEFLYELRSYHDWQDTPVIIHSHVPPALKAISPMLWDSLKIAAYHYKPHTKLAALYDSIDNVLAAVPG